MQGKVVFVVSSIIHCSQNPLSYSTVRSVFTPDERAAQTARTIESIRSKVPSAGVVLVEMGREHAPQGIQSLVDRYLYIGNRGIVRQAADGPHKGYGEVVSLILANRQIRSLQPDYCFKLSGRYHLNDDFRLEHWSQDHFTAKVGGGWLTTALYGFPNTLYGVWRQTLKAAVPFLRQGEAIENTLWRLIPEIQPIQALGVSGSVAPWGGEDIRL